MSEDNQGPRRGRAGATARQGAKSLVGTKRAGDKTTRITLYLGEQTAKRLAVHAALEGKNQSKEADRILLSYLAHRGQGRELFGPASGTSSADPDSTEGSAA